MKYVYIVINGNWLDRVNIVLEREDIKNSAVVSMHIDYNESANETRFEIYSRG